MSALDTEHFGDPVKEQRALDAGTAWANLSKLERLEIVAIKGVDRLSWLHNLTTQNLEKFPGGWSDGLFLDHLGHIVHQFILFDDSETSWLIVDAGRAENLIEFLNKMKFMLRVEVRDATDEKELIKVPGKTDQLGGPYQLINKGEEISFPDATEVGLWALEAERVAARRPRIGIETDHKSIPNELGVLNRSVHMNKGCYTGQETVAKVFNLGQPPRKLVLLHLDGSDVELPATGADVMRDGIKVGFIGSAVRHHELGNIALAVVKRNVADDAALTVDGIAASID